MQLTFNYAQGKYLDFVDNSILIIKIFAKYRIVT